MLPNKTALRDYTFGLKKDYFSTMITPICLLTNNLFVL